MVNNPQMVELQKLTAKHFTKETGIKVHFTVLPENDVRDKISQDFSNQAGQYDVATISNFELPFFAKNGWLHPLDDYARADTAFDQEDILQPLRESLTAEDGKLYAQPFYGESSFLMYRKDVFEEQGLTMPDKPTWEQVAKLAERTDGAERGMKGICLRGLPGWGEVIAPLTTVVNTMGGTWFTEDWEPRLTAPEFKKATKFYVDLVRKHGELGAPQSGYAECLNNMTQGKTAMWYDATAGAGSLEAKGSPVKGKIGYVPAPVEETKSSGWLYTWAWGLQKASKKSDDAWKFVSWASGKEYEELVGATSGWSNVPMRQTGVHLRQPRLPGGGGRVRRRHRAGHLRGRSEESGHPAPPDGGHPVRRRTGVHRPRHPRGAGDQLRHRGPPVGGRRARRLPEAGREGRGGVPMTVTATKETTSPPAPAKKPGSGGRRRAWATRAPLLPALVFLIAVTQLPFVATLVISFFDWNSLKPEKRHFTGLSNYASVFTDEALRESVVTTVVLTASVVIVSVVLGLLFALLLDRAFFGRGFVRTLLITPFLLVPVSAALLWKHALYNPEYGLFNGALTWFGELFGIEAVAQPEWTSEMPLIAVEASLVWQWTPFMMLILLAGLQKPWPRSWRPRGWTGRAPGRCSAI